MPDEIVRLCIRCNKQLDRVTVKEPYCKHCGCPEFRLELVKAAQPPDKNQPLHKDTQP